jgi:hypothetical protein
MHPVIRQRVDREVVTTLRLPEDVCNDWSDEKRYRAPLQAFFEDRLR